MSDTQTHEFAVIGAGIAGASLAYRLAMHAQVLLLERESQPGYHSTGRSAAMFMETYGTPAIRALTRASRAFYERPPAGFCDTPILAPRGVLYVAGPEQAQLLEAAYTAARAQSPNVERIGRDAMLATVPCLRPEAVHAGMREPDAQDIDVHALHQGYLRGFRKRGGEIRNDTEVLAATRRDGVWEIALCGGAVVRARNIVNAAGAWADVIAQAAGVRPVGLTPCRRTAFTFAAPAGMRIADWPAVVGVDESYYFKPDAGQLLGSPANADPVPPHDVAPEEMDVATGIYHIEQATTMTIRRPQHAWAGLRSFVPDGDLVVGWDDRQEGFFWLAAQGGYGIQSAAGVAALALGLLLGRPLNEELAAQGVVPETLRPGRLR
jgi:D-arginine dehydrogenase